MRNINKKKILEGRVRWFDDTSGEGMVSGVDGHMYYLHWSSITGKFPPKNNKERWATVRSGWKVKFSAYEGDYQVQKLKILAKVKPRKQPSFYINKEKMKAKLVAARAAMEEQFPPTTMDWDKYHALANKAKLTLKQKKELQELEAERERHNKALREWNAEKSALIVSIYREHSRFPLLQAS